MARAGRLILLVLLARWTWIFLAWPMRQDTIGASFLHTVSIPFHEAGHVIFAPFGDQIAWTTHVAGAVLMIAALIWGTVLTFQKDSEP